MKRSLLHGTAVVGGRRDGNLHVRQVYVDIVGLRLGIKRKDLHGVQKEPDDDEGGDDHDCHNAGAR